MTIEEICTKAESIALEFNSDNVSPFPYEKITQGVGDLSIYLVLLEDGVSGAIRFNKTSNKFEILINNSKPATRRNFTIAHELGHYYLHKDLIKTEEILIDGESSLDGDNILFRLDDPSVITRIETEANNFAASLIMPKELVIKAWEILKNIEACAKVFNVSTIAMTIRLSRLGLVK